MIVWDVDGTLCDYSHRLHLLPGSTNPAQVHCMKDHSREQIAKFMDPEWVAKDAPIEPALWYLKQMIWQERDFCLITSRWASLRQVTLKWFAQNHCAFSSNKLYMRRNDDIRSSVEVKLELARPFLPFITKWFDDDIGMIAALSKRNINAVLVPDYWEMLKP